MKIAVRISDMPRSGQYDVPGEGDVVCWLKHEGDYVHQGDDLFEFETDKGVVTMPAPVSGKLVDAGYADDAHNTWIRGEVIGTKDGRPVYDPPFCWIETDASVTEGNVSTPLIVEQKAEITAPTLEPANQTKPKISSDAFSFMREKSVGIDDLIAFFPTIKTFGKMHVERFLEKREMLKEPTVCANKTPGLERGLRAAPLARKMARDHGINLASVKGSGPSGLIMACDITAYLAQAKDIVPLIADREAVTESKQSIGTDDDPVLLEMPRLWKTIVRNMEEASRIPTADATALNIRTFDFRDLVWFYEATHQFFPYARWFPVMAAASRVLAREQFLLFNSFLKSDDNNLRVAARRRVHMGIAYDRGESPTIDWVNKKISGERLRILTIRDAHLKSLAELIGEVERLFRAAEAKKIDFADMTGYTFIFNNIGVIGHQTGRSLLGKDISCELNLGYVDATTTQGIMQIVFDHRLIDGAMTAPFLRAVCEEMRKRVIPKLIDLLVKK